MKDFANEARKRILENMASSIIVASSRESIIIKLLLFFMVTDDPWNPRCVVLHWRASNRLLDNTRPGTAALLGS